MNSTLENSINKIPNFDKSTSFNVFVETGFFVGDTYSSLYKNGVLDNCKKCYSIELSLEHYEYGIKNFDFFNNEEKKHNLIHGDSSIVLEELIKIHQNDIILFYLDAHFSGGNTSKSEKYGECPIEKELKTIELLNEKPIIVIDDIPIFIETSHAGANRSEWPEFDMLLSLIEKSKFNFKIINDKENSKLICY